MKAVDSSKKARPNVKNQQSELFSKPPMYVYKRMVDVKLSHSAILTYLCIIGERFGNNQNRVTRPLCDDWISEHTGLSTWVIRHARAELVKKGFINQKQAVTKDRKRIIGKRVFQIVFDDMPTKDYVPHQTTLKSDRIVTPSKSTFNRDDDECSESDEEIGANRTNKLEQIAPTNWSKSHQQIGANRTNNDAQIGANRTNNDDMENHSNADVSRVSGGFSGSPKEFLRKEINKETLSHSSYITKWQNLTGQVLSEEGRERGFQFFYSQEEGLRKQCGDMAPTILIRAIDEIFTITEPHSYKIFDTEYGKRAIRKAKNAIISELTSSPVHPSSHQHTNQSTPSDNTEPSVDEQSPNIDMARNGKSVAGEKLSQEESWQIEMWRAFQTQQIKTEQKLLRHFRKEIRQYGEDYKTFLFVQWHDYCDGKEREEIINSEQREKIKARIDEMLGKF